MNIKKQLALAQLDQLEQQDTKQQQEETMRMLSLLLGAKQSEDTNQRASQGLDLEDARFQEAQRQFGLSRVDGLAQRTTLDSRYDEDIKHRDTREQLADTHYNADKTLADTRYSEQQTKENAAKTLEQTRYDDAKEIQKKNALLSLFQSQNIDKETANKVLSIALPEYFKPTDAITQKNPQGGVATPEMMRKTEEAAAAPAPWIQKSKDKVGGFFHHVGVRPANFIQEMINSALPKDFHKMTLAELFAEQK